MKQLGSSSLLRFNASSNANRKIVSEPLLLSLALMLVIGLSGCKSSQQAQPVAIDPERIEIGQLATAIAELRSQNVELNSQSADLRNQNTDLRDQNEQLRQALETALDAQEKLTNQMRQISEEMHSTRDDLTLVREQLRDLELEHETKPVESTSGTMTAQKPR
jgi:uncharacterized phage infection (PIP) family protein YhgE